ncbi:putative Fe-Mo cluster-binding NifX family protein [Desulfobaculum xiamenense]|uniref:Putative Fe-Mo cluster-binding NifX family protein n=1 Tax=Desulfobaculum xiamenense TaxID=995050 RepID=A0A846QQ01_9BACT|nr:NifB/NifX family molybdenum-iron cluster-binding protein [Desulfobaculum xiamenense]NJB69257.1 putative Fe-Mo cluster-binding NifX family protein [Desulfobaculum xiamenense]
MTQDTIIAICGTRQDLDAPVEPVLGRANFFHIANLRTGETQALPNPYKDMREGCGVLCAQFLAERGVHAVLTGNCGPRAARALREAGLSISYPHTGSVREAMESFRLKRTSSPQNPEAQPRIPD